MSKLTLTIHFELTVSWPSGVELSRFITRTIGRLELTLVATFMDDPSKPTQPFWKLFGRIVIMANPWSIKKKSMRVNAMKKSSCERFSNSFQTRWCDYCHACLQEPVLLLAKIQQRTNRRFIEPGPLHAKDASFISQSRFDGYKNASVVVAMIQIMCGRADASRGIFWRSNCEDYISSRYITMWHVTIQCRSFD